MRIESKAIINQRIQRIKREIKESRQSQDTKQLRILTTNIIQNQTNNPCEVT